MSKRMIRQIYWIGGAFVIVNLISLALQYGYFSTVSTEKLNTYLLERNNGIANTISGEIERKGQIISDLALFVALETDERKILTYIQELMKNGDYASIYYGRSDNHMINGSGWIPPETFDLRTRPWYLKAVEEKQRIITDVFLNASKDAYIITIAAPVYDKTGRLLGVIAGDWPIKNTMDLVNNHQITSGGYSFLVDQNGNVLAHPKYKDSIVAEPIPVSTLSKALDVAMQHQEKNIVPIEIEEVQGFVAYQPIEGINWVVGSFVLKEEYLSTQKQFWVIFIISVIMVLIVLGILIQQQRKIVVIPLQQFAKDIQAIDMNQNSGYRLPNDSEDPFFEARALVNDVLVKASAYLSQLLSDHDKQVLANEALSEALRKLEETEGELRESRDRVTNILEGTNAGTWEWDIVTGETVFNDRWAEIIGYTHDEIAPTSIDTWVKFTHPDDLAVSDEELNKVFLKEKVFYSVECRMRHKSGHWVWVLDKGKVSQWSDEGKALKMSGTHIDITSRKEMEQALIESEQSYRVLADSGQALIWKSGTDKLCYWFNKVWLQYTGRTLEQEVGNGWVEGVHPEDVDRCVETYVTAFDRQVSFSMDYRLMNVDGTYHWIQDDGCPNYDLQGNFVGYIGYCLDVSNRKAIEFELRIAKEAAELAKAAQSQFLSNMSHEIRTPLNGILGTLQLLTLTNQDEEQEELTRLSKTSSEALLVVINDILDYSKIEAGQLVLESKAFNIKFLVNDIVNLFKQAVDSKGLTINTYFGDGIPEILIGDAFRLRQVFSNLIGNAIKFTHSGHVDVHLDAHRNWEMRSVQLSCRIVDTGIGISNENRDFLFKRFRQADDSNTREYGGTGLGLAICKELVEKMAGEIGVESELGSGSTFYFTCVLKMDEPFDQLTVEDHKKEIGSAVPAPTSILVVDDDATTRKMLELFAGRQGWRLLVANNGRNALEQLAENAVDIILMDVQMPIMDGFMATEKIRKLPQHETTAIIAMTAYALSEDEGKCLDAGMDDYLSKPIDFDRLIQLVEKWRTNQKYRL